LIGFKRTALSLYFGDASWLIGGAGHLSGRAEALPVEDQHKTRKRKARGYTRFQIMKTVIFLISGKLNFAAFNPHVA
jgi:hypothetical protein